jgi:hypothetical protein
MIAKLAYLTTPAPQVYVLNIQICGSDELLRFEISEGHLANIVITGTSLALRAAVVNHHRVTETNSETGREDERTEHRA